MPTTEIRPCDLCHKKTECTLTIHPQVGSIEVVWYCAMCHKHIFSLWIGDDKE